MYTEQKPITKCMYIDLSNLFGGLSELLELGMYLDLSSMFPILNDAFDGIGAIKVYGAFMGYDKRASYYRRMFIRTQNEFMNSAYVPGVHFGKGRISSNGQEKGVDMQLGIDMVNDAHLDKYTDYILFSGDADFTYPIAIIKGLGKNFHYCGLVNRFAINFSYMAWRKVLIDYKNNINTIHPSRKFPKNLKTVDIHRTNPVKYKYIEVPI